jgi:ribosomal protein S12 methylthiotransferase
MKREITRFALESLGCAKNQVDSEIMIASLEGLGFQYTADTDLADLLIINTCGFIGPAKEESLKICLDLRARYPEKKMVLAGCLAQRYGRTLEHELPEIDGFFASKNPAEIGELIENLAGDNMPARIGLTDSRENTPERTRLLSFPGSTYVKIADGCNNRCSYCAIPLIKGGLKSRRREDIVSEIEQFLERGIIELNLIAQDLASYGRDRGAGELTRFSPGIDGHNERGYPFSSLLRHSLPACRQ